MTYRIPPSSQQRLRADLVLFLVAIIWGTAFVVQRVAAQSLSTSMFNGARFLIGAAVLAPFALHPWTWRQVEAISVAGLLMYVGAALQQEGLRFTSATNAGFITGLYVVWIPLLLALVWRQSPRLIVWGAAVLSALGLFLLSTGGALRFAKGDLLELAGGVVWALHVIYLGHVMKSMGAIDLAFGQNLVCGSLSLGVGLLFEPQSLAALPAAWFPVVYTGVISVGVGYTLQAWAQKVAPPADAAILMSLEAVFAALGGWLLLSERLVAIQVLGCILMLAGMILVQTRAYAQPVLEAHQPNN